MVRPSFFIEKLDAEPGPALVIEALESKFAPSFTIVFFEQSFLEKLHPHHHRCQPIFDDNNIY
jgi:hypothetical protein